MGATATEAADTMPVTIQLPREALERIAAIAGRTGSNAAKEISKLVLRALENTPRKKSDSRSLWQASTRPLNSITGGESMLMLAMHLGGSSIREIADYFHLSEDDARTHVLRTTRTHTSPRARRPAA